MRRWTRSLLPLTALVLGACTTPPGQVSSGSGSSEGSSTSAEPPVTTMTATTTPSDDTMGTQGGSGMDTSTSTGSVDTTVGASATEGETTMGVDPTTSGSSSGEPPPPECKDPEDCPNNETCVGGECVDACGGAWGAGTYDYCLDQYGTFAGEDLCGAAPVHNCTWQGDPIVVATCTPQGCDDACDCPIPATGNAVVSCGLLTVGDEINDCFLDCSNGETCPTGMVCQVGTLQSYCAQPVQPLAMYGDCGSVAAPCIDGVCATFSGMYDWAVCVSACPGGVGDCDAPPPGSAQGAECEEVQPPAGGECHLDCDFATDCPAGMGCVDIGQGYSDHCMWQQ